MKACTLYPVDTPQLIARSILAMFIQVAWLIKIQIQTMT